MLIVHDPRCAAYGSSLRPEQPARVLRSVPYLKARHPRWTWFDPREIEVADATLLLAHSPAHLRRLAHKEDFDGDTPALPEIANHARRAVGAALAAARHAWTQRTPAFSLMRPPGHHATQDQAMGFCYLNSVAITALAMQQAMGGARPPGALAQTAGEPELGKRSSAPAPLRQGFGGQGGRAPPSIAIWDFDAHHGNGTQAILRRRPGMFFASVHQSPGYPGTGTEDEDNCRNWPVAPHTSRAEHMAALRASWEAVQRFQPDLILVSAGFDAYARDPITALSLEAEDFAELGRWLANCRIPAAGLLEGGYSEDLPQLLEAFLSAWDQE
jgi:acetoin utilization deacetylase AcuC-like enzyme